MNNFTLFCADWVKVFMDLCLMRVCYRCSKWWMVVSLLCYVLKGMLGIRLRIFEIVWLKGFDRCWSVL